MSRSRPAQANSHSRPAPIHWGKAGPRGRACAFPSLGRRRRASPCVVMVPRMILPTTSPSPTVLRTPRAPRSCRISASVTDAERKADASPVTIADREAEQAMRKLLTAEVPQDGVIGEEFGVSEGKSGRQWVLDPIDGTTALPRRAPDLRHADRAARRRLPGARDHRPADPRRTLARRYRASRPPSTARKCARARAASSPTPPSRPPGRIISTITMAATSWRSPPRPITAGW